MTRFEHATFGLLDICVICPAPLIWVRSRLVTSWPLVCVKYQPDPKFDICLVPKLEVFWEPEIRPNQNGHANFPPQPNRICPFLKINTLPNLDPRWTRFDPKHVQDERGPGPSRVGCISNPKWSKRLKVQLYCCVCQQNWFDLMFEVFYHYRWMCIRKCFLFFE